MTRFEVREALWETSDKVEALKQTFGEMFPTLKLSERAIPLTLEQSKVLLLAFDTTVGPLLRAAETLESEVNKREYEVWRQEREEALRVEARAD
jgi:hypothetical protein